jgi:hypothetical protein
MPSRRRAEKLGLPVGTPDEGARPATMAETWTIETYDTEFARRGVHQPADGKILQERSIAVKHDQRRRIGIASHYKMQSHAIDVEELADRRIAPARDKLDGDVRQHNGCEQQK